jgi:N utilization substance protein B
MKTHKDPRHLERIKIMQQLFSWGFSHQTDELEESTRQILENITVINEHVVKSAPAWPIDKINKIDLAILQLAIYELVIDKKNPPKVIVDEAVELAKEYGSDTTPSFINGALGKLITEQKIST